MDLENRAAGFPALDLGLLHGGPGRGGFGAGQRRREADHVEDVLHLAGWLDYGERAIDGRKLLIHSNKRADAGGADVRSAGEVEA